ncbi:hypothetical protein HDU97_002080 [Phlyctochytrium planicorne]|nr:hypothetical protein HDU97_002080 [Phlyctochytrium planicorne]
MDGVVVYSSSVSGSLQVKKHTTRIIDILRGRKVEVTEVDVSVDEEAKEYMQSKSGKNALPQIFSNGEYKGGLEQLEEANEDGLVKEFLGL